MTTKTTPPISESAPSRQTFGEPAVRFLLEALRFTVLRVHGPPSKAYERVADWMSERQLELAELARLADSGELPRDVARALRKAGGVSGCNRHVSARHLCLGLRDLALERWGFLAPTVLSRWGICSSGDVGRLVFDLIDAGQLHKQPGDRIEDFDHVCDLGPDLGRGLRLRTASAAADDSEQE